MNVVDMNSIEVGLQGLNSQQFNIHSGNGLVPNEQQPELII